MKTIFHARVVPAFLLLAVWLLAAGSQRPAWAAETTGSEGTVPNPVTITAGPDWIPLKAELDIEPGSALDFSRLGLQDPPAGKHGRVIARPDGQFAFEKTSRIPQRFYGVNLCFSAQYLSHAEADRLADRLMRQRSWQLPSKSANSSPIAAGAPGARDRIFTRLIDKPFTVTEYNYSGPGRFRGVGGILTGALGALQGWGGIWRFAYSHNRRSMFEPSPMGYFDVASDPLNWAAERATLCLFLRGDLRTAPHSVVVAMTEKELAAPPAKIPQLAPNHGYSICGTGAAHLVGLGASATSGTGGPGGHQTQVERSGPISGLGFIARRSAISQGARSDSRERIGVYGGCCRRWNGRRQDALRAGDQVVASCGFRRFDR